MGPLRLALQYLLSFIFTVQMYLALAVVSLGFLPWALVHRQGAVVACRVYATWVRWSASWLIGLKTEIRGTPPQGTVLVAAKHQSFFDILILFSVLPKPRFVMKRELIYVPLLGQYALRIGCIPVRRSAKGAALKQMMREVREGMSGGGQLTIYAQGTRTAPGAQEPYKIGVGAIYRDTGYDCVPVGTNVGVFWPRRGLLRMPGTAVVEFLPVIPAGLKMGDFMRQLEATIETNSNALMQEAGFVLPIAPEGERHGLDHRP